MSGKNDKQDKDRPKIQWTAEDRARHRAARDMFRNWHPSPEELIASGEGRATSTSTASIANYAHSLRRSSRPARRQDSPWLRCPGDVASTNQPSPAWRMDTTRTPRLIPFGDTGPQWAAAWS